MSDKILHSKAKSYLKLCYDELNKKDLFESRWSEVQKQIDQNGTYELLDFELVYGAKVAWRNSNKCIGRLFWRNMDVLDRREVNDVDLIFNALFEHIESATNKGNIRSTITVFNPKTNIRIWNPQLLCCLLYTSPSPRDPT